MLLGIKDLQLLLAEAGAYKGAIDGVEGPQTAAAIKAVLTTPAGGLIYIGPKQKEAAAQVILNRLGYHAGAVDGLWGYGSGMALDTWSTERAGKSTVKKRVLVKGKVYNAAQMAMPLQKDVEKFYGPMGSNLVHCKLPVKLRIAWDTDNFVDNFACHARIKEQVEAAYSRVLTVYGELGMRSLGLDLYGGCFNIRPMRGGKAYSMHSWGIAIDTDPSNNPLKSKQAQARFGAAEYKEWFDIWEAVGAVPLGVAADMDWQHIQFARL